MNILEEIKTNGDITYKISTKLEPCILDLQDLLYIEKILLENLKDIEIKLVLSDKTLNIASFSEIDDKIGNVKEVEFSYNNYLDDELLYIGFSNNPMNFFHTKNKTIAIGILKLIGDYTKEKKDWTAFLNNKIWKIFYSISTVAIGASIGIFAYSLIMFKESHIDIKLSILVLLISLSLATIIEKLNALAPGNKIVIELQKKENKIFSFFKNPQFWQNVISAVVGAVVGAVVSVYLGRL